MGYCISYKPLKKLRGMEKRRSRGAAVAALIVVALFLCCPFLGEETAAFLRRVWIPGDPEVTISALEQFRETISGGEPVSAAFSAFCREILSYARNPA